MRDPEQVRVYFQDWGGRELLKTLLTPNAANLYGERIARSKSQAYIVVVEIDPKDVIVLDGYSGTENGSESQEEVILTKECRSVYQILNRTNAA